jgi:hypothetical protein
MIDAEASIVHRNVDYGGVHYNSGVLNRLFAVLVDGGYISLNSTRSMTVAGLGIEKSLGLIYDTYRLGLGMFSLCDFLSLSLSLSLSHTHTHSLLYLQ